VLTVEQAQSLWQAKRAVFIDVLPRAPRPANLPPGTLWSDRPRDDIPGSLWLADVGYGALAPSTEAFFRRELRAATHGDRSRTLVFYCLPECWHSWNAAKRAIALGYTHVGWLPSGTDGWSDAGLPLARNEARHPPG
jgi:PQQ-dependent catabolism-associated CXXCW motif protein